MDPPKDFISEVKSVMVNFVWNGKRPKVKYNILIQDKCDGGVGLPNLEARLTAQRLMWVKRLFCTDGKPWKYCMYVISTSTVLVA